LAKYVGPNQTHNIGSPSGVIVNYNMTIYGRGRNGDVFLVHKDDATHKEKKFMALAGGAITAAEKMLNLKPAGSSPKVNRVVVPEEFQPKVIIEDVVLSEDPVNEDLEVALAELKEVAEVNGTNVVPLSKSEAMLMKDFVTAYGFTHQLQVMAKIRSGELFSYKNEDGKTLVYHRED